MTPGSNAASPPSNIAAPPSTPTLEALFRSERRRLLGYFKRRVGSEAAADCVQEVFVRAAGHPHFGELDNPAGYVQRIARNLLIDLARRRRSNPAIFVTSEDQDDRSVPPEQAWAIEATDLLRVHRQMIDALPVKTRRVFVLHRHEGLSYRQIADATETTVTNVEYHMSRALAVCRLWLAAYDAGADFPSVVRSGQRHARH